MFFVFFFLICFCFLVLFFAHEREFVFFFKKKTPKVQKQNKKETQMEHEPQLCDSNTETKNKIESLDNLNSSVPLCILISFDLESSGLKVFEDQITEIGAQSAVLYNDGRFQILKTNKTNEDFSQRVKCVRAISAKSQKVTKISAQDLVNAQSLVQVLPLFDAYIKNVCMPYPPEVPRVLIAHGGTKFDIPLLVAEIQRAKLSAVKYMRQLRFDFFLDSLLMSREVVDTVLLPRDTDGKPCFKLGGIYNALCKTELVGAHGALADSAAVLKLITEHDCFKKAFMNDFAQKSKDKKKYLINLMEFVEMIVNKKLPKPAALSKSMTNNTVKQPALKKTKTMLNYFMPDTGN